MRRVAAMLRAVNVSGTGKLVMADLRALLAGLGYDAPQTLLASGNAVFGTDAAAEAVERRLEDALKAQMGLATDVFVRDRAELLAVIDANPFGDFAREQPSRMMAVFLKGEPPADLSPLERWALDGEMIARGPRCLYITYPQGSGRSKLANARAPGAPGTSRNWNTVGKLAAMLA
ncbi:DUF1697 domain-containing protein [Phenylobacterium sp.]|uniref:DUF1697 domain-containing protein n=1 Tax=Phenylobacterium sp. TaxID=1871053 RepID=UPI002FDFBFAC